MIRSVARLTCFNRFFMQLSEQFGELSDVLSRWLTSSEAESSAVSRLKSFVEERDKPDAIHQSDVFVNALLKLLHGKGNPVQRNYGTWKA